MFIAEITDNFKTLMNQGPMTAEVYLMQAVQILDAQFGEGYAKKTPSLVGMFMLTAALDAGGGLLAQQIRAGLQECGSNVSKYASTISDAIEYAAKDVVSEIAEVPSCGVNYD